MITLRTTEILIIIGLGLIHLIIGIPLSIGFAKQSDPFIRKYINKFFDKFENK